MRIPRNTYRLQITPSFDLPTAARTLDYLHDLGVDWVYLSPLLTAQVGSDHGYDVADHWAIDPARGGAAGLARLSAKARRLGMGILVDIVPNHVGIGNPWENRWWWDVLGQGRDSVHASAFDIDWEAGGGRIQLPVVADADLLPDGRIDNLRIVGDELRYHEQRFPLAEDSAQDSDEDPNAVHARQHYALVGVHEADRDLNYRRFFAVNTLAAIRVEDRAWFTLSHGEIQRWFDQGLVDGLRVDHIDGLRDPQRYFDDLADVTGGAYVLVEKILAIEGGGSEPVTVEQMPSTWAIAGTTGYEAMALIDRVLVDPAGEAPLTALEDRLRSEPVDWRGMVREGKLAVAHGMLNSEVRRISREVVAYLGADTAPDVHVIGDAVAELMAELGVYRTYLPFGVEHLDEAFARAAAARPDLNDVLDVLRPVLSDPRLVPAQRFQQTSGMVMAKGVEDNSFYRWSRLTSLNEVGGDPDVFAVTVQQFHELMAARQDDGPTSLTAGTTHDTKRGEDARARISVLAEVPDIWADAMDELITLLPVRDRGFANLLAQAVLGAWPASPERLHAYARKAMREAGEHTWWNAPAPAYEGTFQANVDAIFTSPEVGGGARSDAGRGGRPGTQQCAGREAAEHDRAGCPGRLSGQRAVGAQPRRPGQPASGGLLSPEGAARPAPRGRPAHADRRPGGRRCREAPGDPQGADAAPRPSRALHPLRAANWRRAPQPIMPSPSTAAARSLSSRGCPSGWPARAVGATPSCPLPDGAWSDEISGREVSVDPSGAAPLVELLARYPVALVRPRRRGALA